MTGGAFEADFQSLRSVRLLERRFNVLSKAGWRPRQYTGNDGGRRRRSNKPPGEEDFITAH
jgi:hypothetical protein